MVKQIIKKTEMSLLVKKNKFDLKQSALLKCSIRVHCNTSVAECTATIQYCLVENSTVQISREQFSTVQCSTVQLSTVKYITD